MFKINLSSIFCCHVILLMQFFSKLICQLSGYPLRAIDSQWHLHNPIFISTFLLECTFLLLFCISFLLNSLYSFNNFFGWQLFRTFLIMVNIEPFFNIYFIKSSPPRNEFAIVAIFKSVTSWPSSDDTCSIIFGSTVLFSMTW